MRYYVSIKREVLQAATIVIEADNRDAASAEADALLGRMEQRQIVWTEEEQGEPWIEDVTEMPADARTEAEAER